MFSLNVLDVARQGVKRARPKAAVVKDPPLGMAERSGSQRAVMHPAIDSSFHQACAFEHTNVPGNSRERHSKRFGKFGNHGGPAREACQQSAARAISQSAKDQVELGFR
jgi:hypothetical protein